MSALKRFHVYGRFYSKAPSKSFSNVLAIGSNVTNNKILYNFLTDFCTQIHNFIMSDNQTTTSQQTIVFLYTYSLYREKTYKIEE